MNTIRKLTGSDSGIFDVRSQLEQQIQNQETKSSCWRFDKFISMTLCFYKTTEIKSKNHVKFLFNSPALLNTQDDEKFCFP